MPTSCQFFYEFINDWGDLQGITLMALYADLRVYLNLVSDQAPWDQLNAQAKLIYQDYILDQNTYEMEANDITRKLQNAYIERSGRIMAELDGKFFEELYEFCIGALEVYYAVFKKSDRFEQLKFEVDRQEIMYHVLRKYNLISN